MFGGSSRLLRVNFSLSPWFVSNMLNTVYWAFFICPEQNGHHREKEVFPLSFPRDKFDGKLFRGYFNRPFGEKKTNGR